MRTWVRAITSTPGAVRDASEHLTELADAEDSLSKAKTLEELHYQRGRVDGIKSVLFLVTSSTK